MPETLITLQAYDTKHLSRTKFFKKEIELKCSGVGILFKKKNIYLLLSFFGEWVRTNVLIVITQTKLETQTILTST